ncbi:MAG: CYTH domain-containing protein [Cytophagaceae bacterium]
MALEIERKFLVQTELWDAVNKPKPSYLKQGYLISDDVKTVRVRIADDKAYITIKSKSTPNGFSRHEFEYLIPVDEAQYMLEHLSGDTIEKHRYKINIDGNIWEVDVFSGDNEGLIVAEIELKSEEQTFTIPSWASKEVTGEVKYYNSKLGNHPFKKW